MMNTSLCRYLNSSVYSIWTEHSLPRLGLINHMYIALFENKMNTYLMNVSYLLMQNFTLKYLMI